VARGAFINDLAMLALIGMGLMLVYAAVWWLVG
jgi:hypothetical protein